jgi:hypothetical protein
MHPRKWTSYMGLSKECITHLLGEPMDSTQNEYMYFFGDAESGMVIGKLYLYFRYGKVRSFSCKLV